MSARCRLGRANANKGTQLINSIDCRPLAHLLAPFVRPNCCRQLARIWASGRASCSRPRGGGGGGQSRSLGAVCFVPSCLWQTGGPTGQLERVETRRLKSLRSPEEGDERAKTSLIGHKSSELVGFGQQSDAARSLKPRLCRAPKPPNRVATGARPLEAPAAPIGFEDDLRANSARTTQIDSFFTL